MYQVGLVGLGVVLLGYYLYQKRTEEDTENEVSILRYNMEDKDA